MTIEELVKKYWDEADFMDRGYFIGALTEQAETHAIELRTHEATVANLEQRIKDNEQARALSECAYKIQVSNLEGKIRQIESERVNEALPYWPPCNPGCDPEFNGCRSKGCANLCDPARKAMLAAGQTQEKACGDERACVNCYTGVGECIAKKKENSNG